MKTDCFYVFENKAVAIVEMLADDGGRQRARIRHIQREKRTSLAIFLMKTTWKTFIATALQK
jgi:hypothetical protein